MVRARMAVRRRSKPRCPLSWAALTVAPWCAATAMLVSFTADAGQEPTIGVTRLGLTALAAAMPDDLVPSSGLTGPAFPVAAPASAEARDSADEAEPRAVAKAGVPGLPLIDGGARADPAVAVRPTFDTGLRAPGSLARYRLARLTFGDPDLGLDGFAPVAADAPPPELGRLLPLPPTLSITTPPSRSANLPAAAGDATPHVEDGSTPAVSRAETLASTTPAPADATPIAIEALPKFSRGPNGLVTSDGPVVGIAPAHPDYAAMIETAKSPQEQRCLAEAVYFEARSEPEEGQAAVAQVVLNRAMSGLYPGSVCAVVFQNQQHHNACQFSFACEGHALRVTEDEAWARAQRIAREVTDGIAYVSDIGASTHYHANYVRPFWARALRKTDVIGHHIFYALKPGQT